MIMGMVGMIMDIKGIVMDIKDIVTDMGMKDIVTGREEKNMVMDMGNPRKTTA